MDGDCMADYAGMRLGEKNILGGMKDNERN